MADALIVAAITAQSGNLGESDLEPTAALRFRPTEKRTGVFKARGIKIRICIFAYFIFEAEKRSPALINSIRPLIKNCILRNLIIIRIQRISAAAGKIHRDSSTTAVFESVSDATASSSTALREIGLKSPLRLPRGNPACARCRTQIRRQAGSRRNHWNRRRKSPRPYLCRPRQPLRRDCIRPNPKSKAGICISAGKLRLYFAGYFKTSLRIFRQRRPVSGVYRPAVDGNGQSSAEISFALCRGSGDVWRAFKYRITRGRIWRTCGGALSQGLVRIATFPIKISGIGKAIVGGVESGGKRKDCGEPENQIYFNYVKFPIRKPQRCKISFGENQPPTPMLPRGFSQR